MRLALLILAALVADAQQIDHIWGRIMSVSGNAFEVDQNFNADPKSAYRRQQRRIVFDAQTQFQSSASEDLRPGRTVDVIGFKRAGTQAQATRITVYEGNKPTRMPTGARIVAPDGTVR